MPLEIVEQYQQLADAELIVLAADEHQLEDDARDALRAELARRNIDCGEVQDFVESRQREAVRKKYRELSNVSNGNRGSGRAFYGKANRKLRYSGRLEEYDSILFHVLFWFPLIPLGGYRLIRSVNGSWFVKDFRVIGERPLDWEQVLVIWVKAASIALAILLVLKFVVVPIAIR